MASRRGGFTQENFLKELQANAGSFEDSQLSKYTELARLSYVDDLVDGYEEVVKDDHERIIGKKDGAMRWLGFRGSGLDPAHWAGKHGNFNALPGTDSVFRGFGNAMEKFLVPLQSWCEGCEVIHVTGHSRGAALATLAGWHLAKHFQNVTVYVVAFACPRVGMASFAEGCRNTLNLRWVGFQHRHDPVGKVPPWGQHVHQPADPLTDFGTNWGNMKAELGSMLKVMGEFASNSAQAHSMESYHKSLKCNFILSTGTAGVTELIETITDPRQKAMLAIGVQAVQSGTSQVAEQMKQMHGEIEELLSSERLGALVSEQFLQESATQVLGKTSFLKNMCEHGEEEVKRGAYALEDTLHWLIQQIKQPASRRSTSLLTLLIETFLKGALMLARCRWKYLGDTPQRLQDRFRDLANDLHGPLLEVARQSQDTTSFHDALPSLAKVEAACSTHLKNSEPLLLTDDIRDALLPQDLQPSNIQQGIRRFAKEFQAAAKRPGCVARLLSTQGLGQKFIDLLTSILDECDSADENMSQCRGEVKRLKDRMDALVLPEVALTGPTKAGKSSLVNSILGMDVASTKAGPDSLLPVRYVPQGGPKFHLEVRGMDRFKSRLEDQFELQEMLRARDMDTAEEVQEAIRKINQELRKFLESNSFEQMFSAVEQLQLQKQTCAEWAVEIKMPKTEHAPPMILVDLPGSTEGGVTGEFIRTMVAQSCLKASTALLVVAWNQVAELDSRDGVDPWCRFFGSASVLSYFLIVTQVFEKSDFDDLKAYVEKRAGKLLLKPLGIRFINSNLLSAWAVASTNTLPQRFPVLDERASETDQQRSRDDQRRCEIVFKGTEGRMMKDKDKNKFNRPDVLQALHEKLHEFPDTCTFIQELSTSVYHCFPQLFLGPPLRLVLKLLEEQNHTRYQQLEIFRKDCGQREQEMQVCTDCLDNLQSKLEALETAIAARVEPRLRPTGAGTEEIAQTITRADMRRRFGPYLATKNTIRQLVLPAHDSSVVAGALEVIVEVAPEEISRHFQCLSLEEARTLMEWGTDIPMWLLDLMLLVHFPVLAGLIAVKVWTESAHEFTNLVLIKFVESKEGQLRERLEQRLKMLKEADANSTPSQQLEQEKQLQQSLHATCNLLELSAWLNERTITSGS